MVDATQPSPPTPSNDLPKCRLILRGKKSTEVLNVDRYGTEVKPESQLQSAMSAFYVRSEDGSKLAIHSGTAVEIVDTSIDGGYQKVLLPGTSAVQTCHFSPKTTKILTWERNVGLKIFSVADGNFLKGLSLKMIRREAWPNVQWTHDEKYFFYLANNEVHVYDCSTDLSAPNFKFRCEGIASFSLAPTSYDFTSFVPQKKGKPARFSAHRFQPSGADQSSQFLGVCSKSMFNAEECTIKWSPTSHAALVLTHTSVDTSGASYYGSTNLFLFLMDSVKEPVINTPLAKEGPVLDVAWCPDASKPPCFAALSGKMPAQGCLHHGNTAEPLFLFGEAHRNTISWSPHGRFLCLAGFGNLAGGMDFWDRNKLKKLNSQTITSARVVVGYDWSPDSRLFCVSTTAPRMNVDNGIAIYKYDGDGPTKTMDVDTLYEASWIKASEDLYPNRAATPLKKKKKQQQKRDESSLGNDIATNSKVAAAPTPVGRYIPPSARGRQGGGMSLADRMRAEKEAKMASSGAPRRITKNERSKMMGSKVPGATPVLTPAQEKELKAKKAAEKKEKARLKKEAEEEAKRKAEEEEKLAKIKAQKELENANRADPAKRTKKINKLLRQIDELKSKDPSDLNEDQKKKLAAEEDLRSELAKLSI